MSAVYKAINAVQAELAKVGISKDSKNQQQGYNFRGIDAVYNVLSPMLARNGLCILPRCTERSCVERTNAKRLGYHETPNVEFSGVPAEHSINHPAGGTSAGTQG